MNDNERKLMEAAALEFIAKRKRRYWSDTRLAGEQMADFASQQIERQAWIATDERLPDELGSYLVRCANGKYRVVEYVDSRDYKGRFFRFPYFEHSHSDVIAWMSIPPYDPRRMERKYDRTKID